MSTMPVLTPEVFAEVLSDEDKWYDLGVFLGIRLRDMDHISNNYERYGITRCLFEIYKILQKQKNLDWNLIHKALRKLNNHSLADRVYNRYISPPESQEERQLRQPEKEYKEIIDVPTRIQERFQFITRRLTSLILKVKSFCKECKADVGDVQLIIKRHWGLELALPQENLTISDIFSDERLVSECTIFDYENLELIVEETCNSDTQKKKELLDKIKAFGDIVSEFKSTVETGHLPKLQELKQYSSTRLGIKVEFKVQDYWRNAAVVQFESVMRTVLTGLSDTPKCQMSVKSGCTCFSWIVPEAYAGRVAAVELSETFLKLVGIISLQIGGNVIYEIKEKECETIEAAMIQAIEVKNSQAIRFLLSLGYPLEALSSHERIKQINFAVLFSAEGAGNLKGLSLEPTASYHPTPTTDTSERLDNRKMVLADDPKWFVDLLVNYIQMHFLKSHDDDDDDKLEWDLLREKGILVHSLYINILNRLCSTKTVEPEEFMKLLTRFQLAIEVNTQEHSDKLSKQYFMPFALPPSHTTVGPRPGFFARFLQYVKTSKRQESTGIKAAPLHITFKSDFFVHHFFTRLSTALLKERSADITAMKLELYFDESSMINCNQVTYRTVHGFLETCFVTLKEQTKFIEVQLHCDSKKQQDDFNSVCSDFKCLLEASCQDVIDMFLSINPSVIKEITSFEFKVVCQANQCCGQDIHYLTHFDDDSTIHTDDNQQVVCTNNHESRAATIEEICWFSTQKSPKGKTIRLPKLELQVISDFSRLDQSSTSTSQKSDHEVLDHKSCSEIFHLLRDKTAWWDDIGRELGVELNDRESLLRDININNSGRLERVINIWLESSPSWDQFITALRNLQYNDIVRSITEEPQCEPLSPDRQKGSVHLSIEESQPTDPAVYNVLLRYRPRLLGIIGHPDMLAIELVAKDLLSPGTQDEVSTTIGITRYEKASVIIDEIVRYFEQCSNNHERFLKFCRVLKDHGQPGLNELAEEMEQTVLLHVD